MSSHQVAVVVGAGAGLGNALVTRFADEGMRVAALSRSGGAGQPHRDQVRGYACDATISGQVKEAFVRVRSELGPPSLVVFNVGIWDQGGILDISEDLFEQAWRTGCFAGFLVGRAAAASMLDSGAAPSFSPAQPDRSAAATDLPLLLRRNSPCARWHRRWRVSSAERTFTSRTSSSTA